MSVERLITDNIDVWTSTVKTKSASGRGSSKKIELYGIKKLRELVLELAVRGKLVPQDPTDEPASVLLERIAEEKAQLVKEKKIKKPKVLPDMEKDKPFVIPSNWSWSQLGFLTNYGVCDKAEPTSVSDDTWVLELEDVEKNTSKLLKKVRFSERAFKSSKNQFQSEDVIYGKLRPYLDKVLIADENGVCTTEMIPVRAYRDLTPGYLRLVMKSPYFINYANDSTHGMNLPRMGTDKARAALFPLAPLFEQNRIVTKVDELMLLCDQLEQHTETSIEAHQTLVEVLLNTLTSSADAQELMQNWQRISEHFDALFTTEKSIDTLKQTILQLAVMGKLVQFGETKKTTLKSILTFGPRNGFSPKEVQSETRLKVLKLGATSYGELNLEQSKFIDVDISDKPHLYLSKDDILIQRGNSASFVGSNVLIQKNYTNYIYPDLMMKLRVNEEVLPEYVSALLSSKLSREHMWRQMTGTSGTMPKISKKVVEGVPITFPINQGTQKRVIAKYDELISFCDELKAQLKVTQATQLDIADTIIDKAV